MNIFLIPTMGSLNQRKKYYKLSVFKRITLYLHYLIGSKLPDLIGKTLTNLDIKFPSIADLRKVAQRKIPHFAFEYLDSGTGSEYGVKENRYRLDQIRFMPEILHGEIAYDLSREFMGKTYPLPIGIAPVGMSGLIWPGAEKILADKARGANIPFCLSTVAAALPEDVAPMIGDNGWFQLYVPYSGEVRRDIFKRIRNSGFKKLVVTVDVPEQSRRERQRRAGLVYPPKITLSHILSAMICPKWSLARLQEGMPRLKLLESYDGDDKKSKDGSTTAGSLYRGNIDWLTMEHIRDEWKDDILVKGIMIPEDALRLKKLGIDGIWVSNHSGRQFEGGPAPIEQLPKVREMLGDEFPIVYDSGITGGLDIIRALACGADFVFLGRAFHFAVSALQGKGVEHLLHILAEDKKSNMGQIGAKDIKAIKAKKIILRD